MDKLLLKVLIYIICFYLLVNIEQGKQPNSLGETQNKNQSQQQIIKNSRYSQISSMNYQFFIDGYTANNVSNKKRKCHAVCYYMLYVLHDSMILLIRQNKPAIQNHNISKQGQNSNQSNKYQQTNKVSHKNEYIYVQWQIKRLHLQNYQIIQHKDTDLIAEQQYPLQIQQIYKKIQTQLDNSFLFRSSTVSLQYNFRFNVDDQIMVSGQTSQDIYYWQPVIIGLIYLIFLILIIPFYNPQIWNFKAHNQNKQSILAFVINGFHFNFIFYALSIQTYYRTVRIYNDIEKLFNNNYPFMLIIKNTIALCILIISMLGMIIYIMKFISYLKNKLQFKGKKPSLPSKNEIIIQNSNDFKVQNSQSNQIQNKNNNNDVNASQQITIQKKKPSLQSQQQNKIIPTVLWIFCLVKIMFIPFLSAFFHKDFMHNIYPLLFINLLCYWKVFYYKRCNNLKVKLNLRFVIFYNITTVFLVSLNRFYPTFHFEQSYYIQILYISILGIIMIVVGIILNYKLNQFSISRMFRLKNEMVETQFEISQAQKSNKIQK